MQWINGPRQKTKAGGETDERNMKGNNKKREKNKGPPSLNTFFSGWDFGLMMKICCESTVKVQRLVIINSIIFVSNHYYHLLLSHPPIQFS